MGYYANGSGGITFARELKLEERNQIENILDGAWFDLDFFDSQTKALSHNPHGPIGVDVWQDEKYHGEEVIAALNAIAAIAPIQEGRLTYVGEDDSHWRFLYKQIDRKWHEQDGYVVYREDPA